jgi:hypothetical protein
VTFYDKLVTYTFGPFVVAGFGYLVWWSYARSLYVRGQTRGDLREIMR